MKTSCRLVLFLISFLLINRTIPAQETNLILNQAELLKKFEGTWICEIGKDTIAEWEMVPFGTGFDARLKYISGGKTVKEGKGLYGYDKILDKIVEAGITKGKDIGVYIMWFTSENKWLLISYLDLQAPEKAYFKMIGEFRSPDNLVEMNFANDKIVKIKSWSRTKQ